MCKTTNSDGTHTHTSLSIEMTVCFLYVITARILLTFVLVFCTCLCKEGPQQHKPCLMSKNTCVLFYFSTKQKFSFIIFICDSSYLFFWNISIVRELNGQLFISTFSINEKISLMIWYSQFYLDRIMNIDFVDLLLVLMCCSFYYFFFLVWWWSWMRAKRRNSIS